MKLPKIPYFLLGYNPKSIFVLEDRNKRIQCPIFSNQKSLQKFKAKFSDVKLQELILNSREDAFSVLSSSKIIMPKLKYIIVNPDMNAKKILCYTFDEFMSALSRSISKTEKS